MKKKAVCLVLAVFLLAMLAGCGCQHEWQDATCTAPQTCAKCGKTEGEALGHKWEKATCTAAKTCVTCGETDGEALAHIQGEWEIATEATYSNPGIKKVHCTLCGEVLAEESFIKERIQNGVFVFSRQELMDMLEEALAEYSSDFSAFESSGLIAVADYTKVDYMLYFLANNETVTRKKNDPLNADSLMAVFANKNNRSIHISTLIECCCPEIDTTILDESVKQIQNGKKVIMGNLSFITGEFQGYEALFIEIEG